MTIPHEGDVGVPFISRPVVLEINQEILPVVGEPIFLEVGQWERKGVVNADECGDVTVEFLTEPLGQTTAITRDLLRVECAPAIPQVRRRQ